MSTDPSSVFAISMPLAELPEGLFTPSSEAGEVVVLLVDAEARSGGWGGEITLALAGLWSERGLRVFLADGAFDAPELHERVGMANGEGVSDAVLYGASPTRIAHYVENQGFLFASAGTVVPDPDAVYRDARWPALLQAFRESGAVLLLYLPEDAAGVGELVTEGDRVIRLAANPPAEAPEPGTVVMHPEGAPPLQADSAPPDASSESDFDLDLEAAPDTDFELGSDLDPDTDFVLAPDLDLAPDFDLGSDFEPDPDHEPDTDPEPTVDVAPESEVFPDTETPADLHASPEPDPGPEFEPEPEFPPEPYHTPDPEPLESSTPSDTTVEEPAAATSNEPAPAAPAGMPMAIASSRPRAVKRRASPIVLGVVVVVLVVLAVLGAAFLGYVEIPGLPLPLGFIDGGAFLVAEGR